MTGPRALVRSTTDPKQVKKATETERAREEREANDVRAVMATPEGRRLLWRFIGECGVYRTIYDGHGGRMSFNAGKHDLGLWLVAQITDAEPRAYLTMQMEAAQLDAETPELPATEVPE